MHVSFFSDENAWELQLDELSPYSQLTHFRINSNDQIEALKTDPNGLDFSSLPDSLEKLDLSNNNLSSSSQLNLSSKALPSSLDYLRLSDNAFTGTLDFEELKLIFFVSQAFCK